MFYGWWIVALGSLLGVVGSGILHHSFTVFFLPLKNDFGVSSAAVSLLYAAARLEGGLEGPLVGYLIGRFGPRAMILAGVCMAGGGLLLLSLAQDYWTFFFIYIFIVALGHNAGFFHPISAAVNSWFIRRRGIGFSWIAAAAASGAIVWAPVLTAIIHDCGWRGAARVAGILILAGGVPAALPIRSTPESMGLRPDGDPADDESQVRRPTGPPPGGPEVPVREALRMRAFWVLMGNISSRLFVTVAVNTHLVPILVWGGLSQAAAAYGVSLYGFGTIVAMMAMGWIGDRWSKSLVCALGLVPIILAMAGLIVSQTPFWLYALALGQAVAMGTAPLNWALIGDLFGRESYATLRGIMGVSYGTATFLSPIYAGWIYDTTGSYVLALATFVVVSLATALSFLMLPSSSPSARTPRL
jgi:MFS family permease